MFYSSQKVALSERAISCKKRLLSYVLCSGLILPSAVLVAEELQDIDQAIETAVTAWVMDEYQQNGGMIPPADSNVDTMVEEEETIEQASEEVVAQASQGNTEEQSNSYPNIDTPTETQTDVSSLMDTRQIIFSVGTFFSIDTIGDPDSVHIKAINKPLAQISTFSLKKYKNVPGYEHWKKINVLRRTNFVYSANLKFDNKYKGYRNALLGELLERILFLQKKYTGTILLDEYKNFPLWNVALNDVEELREFLTYLENTLAERGKRTFDEKPVIRLILKNDVLLKSLDAVDVARIKSLFDMVDLKDIKTIHFFDSTQFSMDKMIHELNAGKPIEPGLGLRQHILKALETPFSNFDFSEWVPSLSATGIAFLITTYAGLITGDIIKPQLIKWHLLPQPKEKP